MHIAANEEYLGKIFFVLQIFNIPRWLVVQEMLNLIFIEIISPDC